MLFCSQGIAQNRYLPTGHQLWSLYDEWDPNPPCYTRSCFANPDTVSYNTTFHQQVSDVFDSTRVSPKRTLAVWASFGNPSDNQVSHVLVTDGIKPLFLGPHGCRDYVSCSSGLTLRFVFFGGNDFVLIIAERNRTYAVTKKNLTVTSCLCAISISQLILGLCTVAYMEPCS